MTIQEIIETAGCIDPDTIEVVRELEEFNHDCFPLAQDWSGENWLIQQPETILLPETVTSLKDVLRFITEQKIALPEWKKSWLTGPAYTVTFSEEQPPVAELLNNHLAFWTKLRDVKPADQGVWSHITWRRLKTNTNLLGQHQVGDGQKSTMLKISKD